MTVVLDASAVLAVINREHGAARVRGLWSGGAIGAVNFSEVVSKLVDYGLDDDEATGVLEALPVVVHPFDAAQARLAGSLRRATRVRGLSLGDRACLALAAALGVPAVTADRAWDTLDLDVPVTVVR